MIRAVKYTHEHKTITLLIECGRKEIIDSRMVLMLNRNEDG